MKPQKLLLKVKGIDWLNERIVQLMFTPVDPTEIEFIPGQHMSIRIDDSNSRPYCFFTNSNNKKEVGLLVSAGHAGVGANYLKKLSVGDEVEALGPLGRKVINTDYASNIVFVATGTGIAPMLSMLDRMADDRVTFLIKLYFGLQTEEGTFAIDKLDELKNTLSNFEYEIVLSQPSKDWMGKTGYVTDYVEAAKDTQYYIIGHKDMVEAATEKLLGDGVPRENIIS